MATATGNANSERASESFGGDLAGTRGVALVPPGRVPALRWFKKKKKKMIEIIRQFWICDRSIFYYLARGKKHLRIDRTLNWKYNFQNIARR